MIHTVPVARVECGVWCVDVHDYRTKAKYSRWSARAPTRLATADIYLDAPLGLLGLGRDSRSEMAIDCSVRWPG